MEAKANNIVVFHDEPTFTFKFYQFTNSSDSACLTGRYSSTSKVTASENVEDNCPRQFNGIGIFANIIIISKTRRTEVLNLEHHHHTSKTKRSPKSRTAR